MLKKALRPKSEARNKELQLPATDFFDLRAVSDTAATADRGDRLCDILQSWKLAQGRQLLATPLLLVFMLFGIYRGFEEPLARFRSLYKQVFYSGLLFRKLLKRAIHLLARERVDFQAFYPLILAGGANDRNTIEDIFRNSIGTI